ncbi:MAG: ABC transporter ATP-binding protein [Bdellovibrionales bacterium]|nr:ABC transporter ATP-binding protein [Bdellovibrionales bacterium]
MLFTVKSLKKTYSQGGHAVEALKGVDLEIQKGQFVTIMGPSGSGKSTLLHLLGGLDRPTAGSVILNGQAIDRMNDEKLSIFRRRHLGFIFQFFNLLPTLTAVENVALPMLLDKKVMKDIEPRAVELLKKIGLGHRLTHTPDQLSGGEMQRVAICRALVSNPLMILADEPTGNLDSKTGESVLGVLRSMAEDQGKTIVMVTHDPKAASFGTRLIRVRDGNIESDEAVNN